MLLLHESLEIMKKYKHIYFDLDHTLWDYKANSHEAFRDIYDQYELYNEIDSLDTFINVFVKYNDLLWDQYRKGEVKKKFLMTERFVLTLGEFGIQNHGLAEKIGHDYITLSPYKTNLLPHTHEALTYLFEKYNLYILTNGFNEVQFIKLKESRLTPYFKNVITSENAGYQKPRKEIFEYALKTVNARKSESLMVGDDLKVDVVGARDFGIDQVFFNPDRKTHTEKVTFEISSLGELQNIL